MLIKCPECGLQVSNKAEACPHCGCPIAPKAKRKTKHMRLPNGFGQISEIKGKQLRNPWRAMITVGKDEKGRPICKVLKPQGYFPTYNAAYAALMEYNQNPYDLDDDITMQQLYDKWSDKHFENISRSTKRTITSAWGYCSEIYDLRVKEVRARHMKHCIDNGTLKVGDSIRTTTPNIKQRIKAIFNELFDYAVEYDLVDKNYARRFKLDDTVAKEKARTHTPHMVFTNDEMKILWNNLDYLYAKMMIIQCYTGLRPQELGLIEVSNVNINEGYMIAGMKTEAGKDRIVPIHSCIKDLIKEFYDSAIKNNYKYLVSLDGKLMTYELYKYRYETAIKRLGLSPGHKPHDPRKQFVTMAKKYNLDEYAIKHIVGHSIRDITESVYTERNIEWLSSEIEKIKVDV